MTTSLITPADLGLPPKFSSWRPGQWECIETAVETDKRFVALSLSTGAGKSLTAVTTSLLTGGRAVYLTSSKSLQDQLTNDFQTSDMRGRQNYECIKSSESDRRLTCNEGRILECRTAGCGYQAARQDFLKSTLALTNYAYALSSTIRSEGVGNTDVLIADECHTADKEISNAIEIRLNHPRHHSLYNTFQSFPPYGKPLSAWRTWATFLLPKAQSHLRDLKQSSQHKSLAIVDAFVFTLTGMSQVPESWILDESDTTETLISPLWPTEYAGKYLFRDVKKVILVSATLVPKTLQLLGVSEDQSLFLSQDHTFDPNRCPVYLYGACYVDYKMQDGHWLETVGRMDTIIDRRLDRKGIIHCVSYERQRDILRISQHASIMFAPTRASELKQALEDFKKAAPPAILISPAITTGYDFPMSECEYQIVIKVPYIDSRSPVMAARKKADPEYLPYLTGQTLTQELGRGMRSAEDKVESFILDLYANRFLKQYRHLFPPWLLRQVRYANELPAPPPPLSLAA